MLHFAVFFILPLVICYMLGLRKVVAWSIAFIAILLVLALGTVTGMLFEALFFPKVISSYAMPALWTNSYAEGMENIGQAFAIPYIFVADVIKTLLHYTFTHATFVVHIFQFFSVAIIANFVNGLDR